MENNVLKHSTSCGRFQTIQVLCIQMPRFVSIWGIFLMLFGIYDPGWRCVIFDHNSHHIRGSDNSTRSIIPENVVSMLPAKTNISRYIKLKSTGEINTFFYNSQKTKQNHAVGERHQKTSSKRTYDIIHNDFGDDSIDDEFDTLRHNSNYEYNGTCDVMETCQQIQFNPESSTIVTEFGLVCDKDWIPSLILTVVNAGFVIGSFVSGQVSERFGRKAGLYGSTTVLAIASGAAVFSPNWQTYTFFTFFIGAGGFGIISASLVFSMEFLNSKWRGYMSSRPVATLSLCVLSLVISLLKSWKYLHAVTCVATSLSLVGYFVVTESPRWLFVNSHNKKGYEIVQKIAKRNQKPLIQTEKNFIELIERMDKEKALSSYSYLDILRRKEHVITTFKFSTLMILELFIYHALIFGVKSIPGDFYTNAIVSSLIQAAIVLSAGPISNLIGRRISGFVYCFLGAMMCLSIVTSLFVLTSDRYTQAMIIKLSAYLAKATSQAAISVTLLCAAEIFPTAIRSVGVSFVNGIACVGGLVAPYVIPKNGDDMSFAVCFSVMAFCFLLNGVTFYFLPETKNKTLKDVLLSGDQERENQSIDKVHLEKEMAV